MSLSEKNQTAFLIALNAEVEDCAKKAASAIFSKEPAATLSYPPNCGLTPAETAALKQTAHSAHLESALRKLIADAVANGLFGALSIIDGVSDPDKKFGKWSGVVLEDLNENEDSHREMLHDAFFDAYWNWRKLRPEKKWRLDVYDGK